MSVTGPLMGKRERVCPLRAEICASPFIANTVSSLRLKYKTRPGYRVAIRRFVVRLWSILLPKAPNNVTVGWLLSSCSSAISRSVSSFSGCKVIFGTDSYSASNFLGTESKSPTMRSGVIPERLFAIDQPSIDSYYAGVGLE